MTRLPLRLVIFDCDGVLVDSEAVANRVVAEHITALGWPMTTAESCALFVGRRLSDIPPVVEARLGRPVPADWVSSLRDSLIDTLGREAAVMPGAAAALDATLALGLRLRVASNSSHAEMAVKFARTGLASRLEGLLHSARDVGVGKPAPDLFLAAAAAEGVPPAACLVVEDSVPGAQAARAAGMACIGLAPHGDDVALREAGAVLIGSLDALPAIMRDAMTMAA